MKSGEVVDEAKEAALFAKIKARYDEQVHLIAASRLWTDAIIDPLDTVLGFLWIESETTRLSKQFRRDSGLIIHYYSFGQHTIFQFKNSPLYAVFPPKGGRCHYRG
jgi:hypothetical protein